MTPSPARMLLWMIDETSGFDSAWASVDGRLLRAEGRACGLAPHGPPAVYNIVDGGGSASNDLAREVLGWNPL